MDLKKAKGLGCGECGLAHEATRTIKHEGQGLLRKWFPSKARWICPDAGLFGEGRRKSTHSMKEI